jgi:hypothetical protein
VFCRLEIKRRSSKCKQKPARPKLVSQPLVSCINQISTIQIEQEDVAPYTNGKSDFQRSTLMTIVDRVMVRVIRAGHDFMFPQAATILPQ